MIGQVHQRDKTVAVALRRAGTEQRLAGDRALAAQDRTAARQIPEQLGRDCAGKLERLIGSPSATKR